MFFTSKGRCTWSNEVFVIGAFAGKEDPQDSNDFLKDFIEEANDIIRDGIEVDGRVIKIRLTGLICDTPAKALALNIKHPTGYASCTKCWVYGEYEENRVCFPGTRRYPKRTDEEFRQQTDEDYQLGALSAFCLLLYFHLVLHVPLDYMHLVCLGVVKKILECLLIGSLNYRIPQRIVDCISNRLNDIKPYIPDDFARKPRGLNYYKVWKATEFRLLLLYIGPVVFKDILETDIYHNFLTLHVAIRILCCEELLTDFRLYAHSLLEHFVEDFGEIYGEHLVSHNVHGLLHLAEDCETHGVLDNFSAFPYENNMMEIKGMLRKPDNILAQMYKRQMEKNYFRHEKNLKEKESKIFTVDEKSIHNEGPLQKGMYGKQYKIAKKGSFQLNTKYIHERCCYLNDGSVVDIENFSFCHDLKTEVAIGKKYLKTENYFTVPCDSSLVGVTAVSKLSKELEKWPLTSIHRKAVKIPIPGTSEKYVAVALLHSN